ncbi:ATP-binding protein [Vibrio taketomensis]|uniref:sensor histidine kinase n=1 Tax=Vibrio taketomensis TaxID=2572923 RepID=UPI00138A19F1|nr:ATP-binding protein [Vibrio taketomensis]
MKIKDRHYLLFLLFFLVLSGILAVFGVITKKELIETDIAMLFLLINIVSGSVLSPMFAYSICIINIVIFHYFVLPDFNSFNFSNLQYLITYCVLTASSFLAVHLTQAQKRELYANQKLQQQLAIRNELAQTISALATSKQIATEAVAFLRKNYQIESAIYAVSPHWQCLAQDADSQTFTLLSESKPAHLDYVPFADDTKLLAELVVRKDQADRIDTWFTSLVAMSLARANAMSALTTAEANNQAEVMRTTLLSSVSHDLKTPLGTIIGAATTLSDPHLHLSAEVRHELLQSIAHQGERLNTSLSKLLDITRYTSGSLQLNRDWTEPEELIGSALKRLKTQLGDHHLLLEGEPMLVDIDALLIEQVITNLVENAAKYSSENSEINLHYGYDDKAFFIKVSNPCQTIPENALDKIFDRFFRLDNHHVNGTGLGLAICRVIVSAHGGTISVRNIDSYGVEFTVRIPCNLLDIEKCQIS